MTRRVHQAEVSKAEAETNIERKLNVLESWLKNGIPYLQTAEGNTFLDERDHKLLDFYPTSLRQFKAWDGTKNCDMVRAQLPVLSTTGNDTLAKRPALEERARGVIAALRIRAEAQVDSNRQSELKRLKSEIQIAEATIKIRNAEIREQRRTLRRLASENATLSQKAVGDAAEFKGTHKTLLAEIETLKLINAQLTAQLAKIAPMRQADAP